MEPRGRTGKSPGPDPNTRIRIRWAVAGRTQINWLGGDFVMARLVQTPTAGQMLEHIYSSVENSGTQHMNSWPLHKRTLYISARD